MGYPDRFLFSGAVVCGWRVSDEVGQRAIPERIWRGYDGSIQRRSLGASLAAGL